jgi:hypothetical protein
VEKVCTIGGYWANKSGLAGAEKNNTGYTHYAGCFSEFYELFGGRLDPEAWKVGS